ncbi:acyl-CoA dehydrogenase family protein [Chloroflexota bacterium]
MAEFGFTEEQEMFRNEMRRLVKKELAPLAKEKRSGEEFMKAQELLKLSVLNFPERIGGWSLDFVHTGILAEELYSGGSGLGTLCFERTFVGNDLKKLPEEVQDEVGPIVSMLPATIRHGYTEADSGNEQAAIRTRAVRQGDYYIINGEKQPATGCGGAPYSVITAVTDPAAGTKGISQFLIPRDTPGVSASILPFVSEIFYYGRQISGEAAPETDPVAICGCVLSLDDVKIPAKYRLGEEGEGQDFLQHQHNVISVGILAMQAISFAKLTLNEMIEYTGQRVHFGQPIIQFQGVGFQLAEHYTRLEAARLLLYRALWLMDQGRANTKDIAMARVFCTEVGEKALLDMLRIGGYAHWSTETQVPQRLLNVIGNAITDGPAQMQKLRILGDIAPDAIPPNMMGRLVV